MSAYLPREDTPGGTWSTPSGPRPPAWWTPGTPPTGEHAGTHIYTTMAKCWLGRTVNPRIFILEIHQNAFSFQFHYGYVLVHGLLQYSRLELGPVIVSKTTPSSKMSINMLIAECTLARGIYAFSRDFIKKTSPHFHPSKILKNL